MGTERKFQAKGVNCFMKSTPGLRFAKLVKDRDSRVLKLANLNPVFLCGGMWVLKPFQLSVLLSSSIKTSFIQLVIFLGK